MVKAEKKGYGFSLIAHIFLIICLILIGIIFRTANKINRMTEQEKYMNRYSAIAYVFLMIGLILIEIAFFLISFSLKVIGVDLSQEK